jgi:hypothetical protein
MATQIVISNEDYITVDGFQISWDEKGTVMPSLPHNVADSVHYVIWNNLSGQNEVQKCDANNNMKGNVILNSATDIVHGSVTVQDLLDWGETRKTQIETAQNTHDTEYTAAVDAWVNAGNNAGTLVWDKTWIDYDPHYS